MPHGANLCSLEYFENYHKVHGISVKLPNRKTMNVTHIGEIRLHLNLLSNDAILMLLVYGEVE